MRLEELAATYPRWSERSAPAWLQGCFRRRSITFYNGCTDSTTEVWWLQAGSLCADLRLQPDRPRMPAGGIAACTEEEFLKLVHAEGGIAETTWANDRMSWSNWTAFQLHDKWNEAATLHRVGDSVVEFAPSGAYVEDWRLQPTPSGPLIGLRLIDERDEATGEVLHRGGGIVVCGDHAAIVFGRAAEIESNGKRLADLAVGRADDPGFRTAVFNFEASYGRREAAGEPSRVVLSTNPSREGSDLFEDGGFAFDEATGQVAQRFEREGVPVVRRFIIDTLQARYAFSVETQVTEEKRDWLQREADTLLAYLEDCNDE